MNRIVLIGNGFDLAHGLKTSYKDFICWYWTDWGEKLLHGLNKTETDGLCSFKLKESVNLANWAYVWGFHYQRKNPLVPWDSNDVISIATEDKDLCDYWISPFLQQICKSIETKKWVDIENEYYDLLSKCALKGNAETTVEELNQQLHTLQEKLIQYLSLVNQTDTKIHKSIWNKIYSPINPKEISVEKFFQLKEYTDWCVKQDNSYWVSKMQRYEEKFNSDYVDSYKEHYHENYYVDYPRPFMLPDHIMLLSFNYTKTAHLYHNHNFYLNYIHGELDNPQNIIFGYGDEIDENYQALKNLNDNGCLCNLKTIKYLETDNYRNALAFMDSAPFQVCIMGHSCGNSDRTLLNTLFEHKNCLSIKPYYYIKEDGTDNYLDIIQNISRNFTDMKLMRDRVVNKTYCETIM
jgi:hypothetical protein